jgi:hypothetical protein
VTRFRGPGRTFVLAEDRGMLVLSISTRPPAPTCSVTKRGAVRCGQPVAYWWARGGAPRDVGYCRACAEAIFPEAFRPAGGA